jgi:Zn-dependent protease
MMRFSTLVMLVILAYFFSTNLGEDLSGKAFALGLVLAILLFASVLVHELAHAAAARACGREVKEVVLTLWGGHTTFDAHGIGPLASGVIALVGPLANFVIAAGVWAVTQMQILPEIAQAVAAWVAMANVFLGVFNILPGIPMDGGRALEAVVWAATGNRYTALKVAAWSGRVIAIAFVVVVVGLPLLAGQSPDLVTIIWSAFIFMLLWPAAGAALRAAHIGQKREAVNLATLMLPTAALAHTTTVAAAIAACEAQQASAIAVTGVDGSIAGWVPLSVAHSVPADERTSTDLTAVTIPIPRGTEVELEADSTALVAQLKSTWGHTDAWVVRSGQHLAGIVRVSDVMKSLQ